MMDEEIQVARRRTIEEKLEGYANNAQGIRKALAELDEARALIRKAIGGNLKLTMRHDHPPGIGLMNNSEFDRHMHNAAMTWVDKQTEEFEKRARQLLNLAAE